MVILGMTILQTESLLPSGSPWIDFKCLFSMWRLKNWKVVKVSERENVDFIHVKSVKTLDSTLKNLIKSCIEYIIKYNQDFSFLTNFDCSLIFFFYISAE